MMGRFMPTKTIIEPEPKQVVEKKESTTVSKSTKKSSPEPIYKCPFCGAEVKKGQKFCTQCGAKLPENLEPIQEEQSVKRCPVCGAELKPGAKFCTQCGAKI
jgi:DNA-directed RNA polymerase subunit RPC12/RpoP